MELVIENYEDLNQIKKEIMKIRTDFDIRLLNQMMF